METLIGTAAAEGVVLGKGVYFSRPEAEFGPLKARDVEAELHRLKTALEEAAAELTELYVRAKESVGEEGAYIFQVNAMMLEDEDFRGAAFAAVRDQGFIAEYAVRQTAEEFAAMLADTGDPYLAGRGADVRDVSRRVIDLLTGERRGLPDLTGPSILLAEDLLPSETMQLDSTKLLALATAGGSATSHTAILAKSLGIPAVVGLGAAKLAELAGRELLVDGTEGTVCVDPDDALRRRGLEAMENRSKRRESLRDLVGLENRTMGGRRVEVYANIGSPEEADAAMENDAGGIGLFRTEFSYLRRTDYPTEEELYAQYVDVARRMAGRKVILRTLDIGGDKDAEYFKLPREENPALGLRGIRLCLARPALFKTQLRAALRAAASENISLMYPMISAPEELDRIAELMEEAREELRAAGLPFAEKIEQGIMVETPAAALMSDVLAKKCEFFSIGSNDLTQYTMAADRQNSLLGALSSGAAEAVLRLIEMTVANGRRAGIWVGICGELGADLSLTERFLAMGLDEFSVVPSAVLPLRKKIRESEL